MSFLIMWVLEIMSVVIMIPFLTLLERKVLSYVQLRKGPKKVFFLGIFQPMSDGVKLMLKEAGSSFRVNYLIYWITPLLKFFLMLMLFIIFSPIFPWFSLKLGMVLYLCLSSILIYTMMFSGWGSKSKYSFLGSLRGGAQMMSYEIGLLTLIFFPTCLANSFKVKEMKNKFSFSMILYVMIFFFWMMTMVAETNRSPFDFAEGESELVSGFNTEYKSMGFALLFLGEYGNIIFLSFFTSFVFFKKSKFTSMLVPILMLFLFLLFRGTFPRFRYDFLMNLVWKILLPLSLMLLWLIFIF